MKRIMIALALVASMGVANAQKSAADFQKEVEAAKAACNNPKKAEKPATWLNLGKKAFEAYTAPQGNGWVGASAQELQLIMTNAKPTSTAEEVIGGVTYKVDTYPTCKYYFDANGTLARIKVTEVYVPDALEVALNAYAQAAKVDPKGTKTKEIVEGISKIAYAYSSEAFNSYYDEDMLGASKLFAKAVDAAATEPNAVTDTLSLYYMAATALIGKDYNTAKDGFIKCIDYGFTEKGEVYAKLAECYKNLGDAEKSKATLEEGFSKCPDNQGILVGLINLYMETKDDPEKLFGLLDKAKVNEPTNASLYYVEGNIRKELGQFDKAVEAYEKCAEVNPDYEFGYVGKGIMYYEQAMKVAQAADEEQDYKKYDVLLNEYYDTMAKSIEPFEQAYSVCKDEQVKGSIAEYLKNIYYRLREKGADYQAGYEKYNEIVSNK